MHTHVMSQMDASAAYPQWPPVVVSAGLGGSVAMPTPDRIPLQPSLVNDPLARGRGGGVDCVGVLQLCHRNLAGYSYLRPFKRTRFSLGYLHKPNAINAECQYFYRHSNTHVPGDILRTHVEEAIVAEHRGTDIPKWQGNALAGMETGHGEHVVFFPSGQILQQARVYHHMCERRRRRVSNAIECGAVIRQFEVLGTRDTYDLYGSSTIQAVARGGTNFCILSANMAEEEEEEEQKKGEKEPTLQALHRFQFDEMLYHVSGSPHTACEVACVTADGRIHWWDPVSGLQSIRGDQSSARNRVLRCEYSSHPCVLWAANRSNIRSMDLRESQLSATALFDLSTVNASHGEIYAVKRRESSPFQIAVGTDVSIELLDSRMPGQTLISWSQQQQTKVDSSIPLYGSIDEVRWDTCSGEGSGAAGLIASSMRGSKVVSVFPFGKDQSIRQSSNGSEAPLLSIVPLRSPDVSTATELLPRPTQYIGTDAPLEVQLRDGGEWTTLIGLCAMSDNARASKATLYQLNSMGDLYRQRVRSSATDEIYDTAVQVELPCGVSTQTASNHVSSRPDRRQQLPLPSDAILSEYDTDSLAKFSTLPVSMMLQKYPRLPEPIATAGSAVHEFQGSTTELATMVDALNRVCHPSATLHRLHRFVNDDLQLHISSTVLLRVLRARPSEFAVHNMHHRFRQPTVRILDPTLAIPPSEEEKDPVRKRGDHRLTACSCSLTTAHEPCESATCVLPHALVVSSAVDWHVETCFASRRELSETPIQQDFATMMSLARKAYGQRS